VQHFGLHATTEGSRQRLDECYGGAQVPIENGTVVQRKTDLLPGQQIRKQIDAGLIVRQWNDELLLKPAADGSIDSLKAT
jgi:hypothetical protein